MGTRVRVYSRLCDCRVMDNCRRWGVFCWLYHLRRLLCLRGVGCWCLFGGIFRFFVIFPFLRSGYGNETISLSRNISYLACGRICVFNTLRFFNFKHFLNKISFRPIYMIVPPIENNLWTTPKKQHRKVAKAALVINLLKPKRVKRNRLAANNRRSFVSSDAYNKTALKRGRFWLG